MTKLYLKSDFTLLADAFEKFSKKLIEKVDINRYFVRVSMVILGNVV